ncbi:MAG: hypothetical protein P8Q23_05785, partial [Paracoccaceae bacterium]|nr:hypothetical protein [Paracoccaceae bacterium]
PSNPVHIEEFERNEDGIIVIVSESYAGARAITIDVDPAATDMATLYLDGVRLAELDSVDVMTGYSPSSIVVGTETELQARLAALELSA